MQSSLGGEIHSFWSYMKDGEEEEEDDDGEWNEWEEFFRE